MKTKIVVSNTSPILNLAIIKRLDRGESGAICLSIELKASLILLDESEARRIADIYNLKKTGVLGILLKAKKEKIISSLREEIRKLKENAGFFISKELEESLLKEADE